MLPEFSLTSFYHHFLVNDRIATEDTVNNSVTDPGSHEMALLDPDLDLLWEYGSGPILVAITSLKIKFKKPVTTIQTCFSTYQVPGTALDPSVLPINEKAEMSYLKA
jgi:hypothetical protein